MRGLWGRCRTRLIQGAGFTIAVLIEGDPASLEGRMNTVRGLLDSTATLQMNNADDQAKLWTTLRDLVWIGDAETVVKLYLPSTRVTDLDAMLSLYGARRVYSVAGNVAWGSLQWRSGAAVVGISSQRDQRGGMAITYHSARCAARFVQRCHDRARQTCLRSGKSLLSQRVTGHVKIAKSQHTKQKNS